MIKKIIIKKRKEKETRLLIDGNNVFYKWAKFLLAAIFY